MALLLDPKVAARTALANYLRTNMAAAWPNLVVSENWPTPERVMPPQAITVITPTTTARSYPHEPVVWSTTPTSGANGTVLYSYARLEIDLQIDIWAQFESIRDDLVATVGPLLNQQAAISLGLTSGFTYLPLSPGLVLPLASYYSINGDYYFSSAPSPYETPRAAMQGEWRATFGGTANLSRMDQVTVPIMRSFAFMWNANGSPTETVGMFQQPTSVSLAPSGPSVVHGNTQQMTATATLADATTADVGRLCFWTSSNPSVATVDQTGLVTTIVAGTSLISATYMGVTGSTTLTST